ncbi:MAG: proton-conducting transporter membrane subunit, partial [Woeseiaceae bacterium]
MMRTDALPFMFDAVLPVVPPAFVFLAGSVVVAFVGRRTRLRQVLLLAVPILGLLNLAALDSDASWVWRVLDFELEQLRVDRLSMLFGLLFHIGALLGAIYALCVRDTPQHVAALAYAGSALGAVFAGDLISLFFYWEGMAIASTFLIWARRDALSYGAGLRYLVLHMLSGLLLLAGAIVSYRATGGIAFDFIGTEAVGGWLILAAIGIKCGFP